MKKPIDARSMQRLGADAIKGTEAARVRASKAGKAISPEAAKLRAQKAAAARWGKAQTTPDMIQCPRCLTWHGGDRCIRCS